MKRKGFTLIELLIVVSIIGILSGIIVQVLNSSGIRSKARDSQRMAALEEVQVALELYFADNAGYPISASWANLGASTVLQTYLVTNGYIDKVASDPEETTDDADPCSNPENNRFNYRTTASGSEYILTSIMDVPTSAEISYCHTLSIWSSLGCGASYATSELCYGVESP